MRRKLLAFVLVAFVTLAFLWASNTPIESQPTKTATFALASWSYPDEYGQGVYLLRLYENSTGSWVSASGWIECDEESTFEWVAGVGVKVKVITTFNSTLVGVSTTNQGKLYHKHNVTVLDVIGDVVVFSKQNFTYCDGQPEGETEIYDYEYEAILDFLPQNGMYYKITIFYEIYW